MAHLIGHKLGNYRLVRLLGQGGFADVYLGEHMYLKTPAAIKVVQMHFTTEALENFLVEARTIARLEHSNIIHVLEFGMEGTIPYLVMNYASEGTLRQRHPRGTILPSATLLSYVKQIAAALQHAHNEGVIHRDIKPENMLVGKKQEILLSDFGLAIVTQGSKSPPPQRKYAGTTAYMAPEQLHGMPCQASDQYALGIVVYEWLCGCWPFTGTDREIAIQHNYMRPPSLQQRLPALAPAVEAVIMKALDKDPKARFAQINDFAQALEEAYSQSTKFPTALSFTPPSYLSQQPALVQPEPQPSLSLRPQVMVSAVPLETASATLSIGEIVATPMANSSSEPRLIQPSLEPSLFTQFDSNTLPSTLPVSISVARLQPKNQVLYHRSHAAALKARFIDGLATFNIEGLWYKIIPSIPFLALVKGKRTEARPSRQLPQNIPRLEITQIARQITNGATIPIEIMSNEAGIEITVQMRQRSRLYQLGKLRAERPGRHTISVTFPCLRHRSDSVFVTVIAISDKGEQFMSISRQVVIL